MDYRWKYIAKPDHQKVERLQEKLGIDNFLTALLVQRGIEDFDSAKAYFRPSLQTLHDPYLMLNMDKAVARIKQAISNKERILIYGDYDVDGTTSVALVYSFLQRHYDAIDTYIPDRYTEGYGISLAGIDYAHDNGISLIIALDCGIKAIKQVDYAAERDIDFIICDHHRPGKEIPNAAAILDPKQEDCQYPYDELSGCGVGFKLVQALCKEWQLKDEEWISLLDLLAISIGADIVPITGENRVLTYHGLKLINGNSRPGIKLLIELAGKSNQELSITDVVFTLGPRINAAGRISHGRHAVDLMTESNMVRLEEICKLINDQNSERRIIDSSITAEALEMIAEEEKVRKRHTTVLNHDSWHKGVIGIVASRLIETHYRPTVIFTRSNGLLAGSARSVKGFDVYKALEECSDILEQFGGHMYAAGMTLNPDRFDDFKARFDQVVAESISEEMLIPEIEVDGSVSFADLTPKFFRILKQFAPFGPRNMAPTLVTHNLINTGGSRLVGADSSHLKVALKEPESGIILSGIGFGMADKLPLLNSNKPVSAAYHLEENNFRGNTSLQLHLKDLKLTSSV